MNKVKMNVENNTKDIELAKELRFNDCIDAACFLSEHSIINDNAKYRIGKDLEGCCYIWIKQPRHQFSLCQRYVAIFGNDKQFEYFKIEEHEKREIGSRNFVRYANIYCNDVLLNAEVITDL